MVTHEMLKRKKNRVMKKETPEDQREKFRQERDEKLVNSEKHLEQHFCWKVRQIGGFAVKMNPIGIAGLPDRMVLYKGKTWFIELKTPRGKVSPVQESMHRRFKMYGHEVRIIRTKEEIIAFIQELAPEKPILH